MGLNEIILKLQSCMQLQKSYKRESADILEPKPYEPKAITEYLRSTIIPDPAKDSPPKLAIGINNKSAIEVDLNAIGNLD